MCGINGVINLDGLTKQDLKYATRMLLANESRGSMATGVALQSIHAIKNPIRASKYITLSKYKNFMERALGQQWAIFHARHANFGHPSINSNNHPITSMEGKFWMMHNGVVGSNTVKRKKDVTDSYHISNAIKKHWIEGDLFTTVRTAYTELYGFAAVVVVTKKEIVIARRWNHMWFGVLPNGTAAFASTEDVLKGNLIGTQHNDFLKNYKVTYEEEIPLVNVQEMRDDSIMGVDSKGIYREDDLPEGQARPEAGRGNYLRNWDEVDSTMDRIKTLADLRTRRFVDTKRKYSVDRSVRVRGHRRHFDAN